MKPGRGIPAPDRETACTRANVDGKSPIARDRGAQPALALLATREAMPKRTVR